MDSKDKKALSETDICDLFITPAIRDAGWDGRRIVDWPPFPQLTDSSAPARFEG